MAMENKTGMTVNVTKDNGKMINAMVMASKNG
jgi:hypothetical protein